MLAFLMMVSTAWQEAPATVHRLVVSAATGPVTTKDYASASECEAARTKVIEYNRRRTDEETRRDKSDRVNHLAVAAACIPL